MLNLIDISSHQGGIKLEDLFDKNPALDGVIIKATEGTGYTNTYCGSWAKTLQHMGKPWGFYHYLSGGDPVAEANYFWTHTHNYFHAGMPCADYEGKALQAGTGYLKRFLDRLYELSGVRLMIYCSLSVVQSQDFTEIAAAGHPLWVAQYADMEPVHGFMDTPWQRGSVAPFARYAMQQYTSCGRLDGWPGNLDFDQYRLSREDWAEMAGSDGGAPSGSRGPDPVVISDILHGKYGIGVERVAGLSAAGYDPQKVQAKVDELYAIAATCKKYVRGNEDYLCSIDYIIRAL